MSTTMTRVLVTLPPELLKQVDEVRGLVPRSAWLRQAAEEKLGRSMGVTFWDPETGEWRPIQEHPGLRQTAAGGVPDA